MQCYFIGYKTIFKLLTEESVKNFDTITRDMGTCWFQRIHAIKIYTIIINFKMGMKIQNRHCPTLNRSMSCVALQHHTVLSRTGEYTQWRKNPIKTSRWKKENIISRNVSKRKCTHVWGSFKVRNRLQLEQFKQLLIGYHSKTIVSYPLQWCVQV